MATTTDTIIDITIAITIAVRTAMPITVVKLLFSLVSTSKGSVSSEGMIVSDMR